MDLNHLMIFKKVAESGSFSKAALALDLPKSSVSQKITKIEQDLGVLLLQRTRAAVSGLGLALLPAMICRPIVARGELVPVMSDWGLWGGEYVALYPSRRFLPAKTSAFLDYLRHVLNEEYESLNREE